MSQAVAWCQELVIIPALSTGWWRQKEPRAHLFMSQLALLLAPGSVTSHAQTAADSRSVQAERLWGQSFRHLNETGVTLHGLIGKATFFGHGLIISRSSDRLLSCLKNLMCYECYSLTSLEMFARFVWEIVWGGKKIWHKCHKSDADDLRTIMGYNLGIILAKIMSRCAWKLVFECIYQFSHLISRWVINEVSFAIIIRAHLRLWWFVSLVPAVSFVSLSETASGLQDYSSKHYMIVTLHSLSPTHTVSVSMSFSLYSTSTASISSSLFLSSAPFVFSNRPPVTLVCRNKEVLRVYTLFEA